MFNTLILFMILESLFSKTALRSATFKYIDFLMPVTFYVSISL